MVKTSRQFITFVNKTPRKGESFQKGIIRLATANKRVKEGPFKTHWYTCSRTHCKLVELGKLGRKWRLGKMFGVGWSQNGQNLLYKGIVLIFWRSPNVRPKTGFVMKDGVQFKNKIKKILFMKISKKWVFDQKPSVIEFVKLEEKLKKKHLFYKNLFRKCKFMQKSFSMNFAIF